MFRFVDKIHDNRVDDNVTQSDQYVSGDQNIDTGITQKVYLVKKRSAIACVWSCCCDVRKWIIHYDGFLSRCGGLVDFRFLEVEILILKFLLLLKLILLQWQFRKISIFVVWFFILTTFLRRLKTLHFFNFLIFLSFHFPFVWAFRCYTKKRWKLFKTMVKRNSLIFSDWIVI